MTPHESTLEDAVNTRRTNILTSGRWIYGTTSIGSTYIAALLVTLLAGPPLLLLLLLIYPLDWDPLSTVGQSYAGVSALLSALALIAVATNQPGESPVTASQPQSEEVVPRFLPDHNYP